MDKEFVGKLLKTFEDGQKLREIALSFLQSVFFARMINNRQELPGWRP